MTTLVGLELTGRRVVVVGAGTVGVRRVRRFVEDGARVVLVDPAPSDDARRIASHGDVDGAWLVVAATSDL
ncbi:MAG: uroporphyrinogen-III C-methyltransferase, partial [Micrococcales bacterium]|nr:uroporphyrinogen-III C-methyltransferase [Micrococcales bacterium]